MDKIKKAKSILAKSNQMFSRKEKNINQVFKKAWPHYYERIESKLESGMPDVLIVNKNIIPIFIELKKADLKGNKVEIEIRRSQIIWHMKYPSLSFALIAFDNTYYLIKGNDLRLIKKRIYKNQLDLISIKCSKRINTIVNYLNSF